MSEHLQRVAVESSTIKSVGYRYRTMEVEFSDGRIYRYRKVARSIYDRLMSAPSKGKFFAAHIRRNPNIPYERVAP